MNLSRRKLFFGAGASLLLAPSIVRASSIMPVKSIRSLTPVADWIEKQISLNKSIQNKNLSVERVLDLYFNHSENILISDCYIHFNFVVPENGALLTVHEASINDRGFVSFRNVYLSNEKNKEPFILGKV